MFRGRRSLIALAVGLTVVLVASPADAKKKKKKKPPAAQQGMAGSATFLLPGGGVQAQVGETPITAQFVEFDSLAGKDNATVEVETTVSPTADVNLEIEIQGADDAWTNVEPTAPAGDPGSGREIGTAPETLSMGRLAPGHYRLIVYLFVGAPTTMADWTLTFFNTAGKPGPPPP